MPNGDELNEQLEFKERIKAMSPDDRTLFIAEQVYALTTKVEDLTIGGVSKKTSAITAGVTTSVVLGIVEGIKALFFKN